MGPNVYAIVVECEEGCVETVTEGGELGAVGSANIVVVAHPCWNLSN